MRNKAAILLAAVFCGTLFIFSGNAAAEDDVLNSESSGRTSDSLISHLNSLTQTPAPAPVSATPILLDEETIAPHLNEFIAKKPKTEPVKPPAENIRIPEIKKFQTRAPVTPALPVPQVITESIKYSAQIPEKEATVSAPAETPAVKEPAKAAEQQSVPLPVAAPSVPAPPVQSGSCGAVRSECASGVQIGADGIIQFV